MRLHTFNIALKMLPKEGRLGIRRVFFAICLCVNERPTFQELQRISLPRHVKCGDLESVSVPGVSGPATGLRLELLHTPAHFCVTRSGFIPETEFLSFLISIHNL